VGIAGLLGGCAVQAVGRPLPPAEVRAIERNVTTLEQVRERFGEPSRVTTDAAGTETWRYRFVSRHSGRLQRMFVCNSIGVLPVLLGAGSSQRIGTPPYNPNERPCSPTRLEQELSLVSDGGVVTGYTYDSRQVLLEFYRLRGPATQGP
jgi:hypothetical protein